ncbi:dihydrodipicolinate synthase family protein [Pseudonocardia nematodicida]|uniref:Dihydrodipicolinate synthase family protein n=1 Tax=Pseudonocardia nematodicida TaxID=1206997 RepID=A0ABV1K9D0_9PSEU
MSAHRFDDVKERIRGVVGINVTPFDATSESIDSDAYTAVLRRAADRGATIFTPNGNTGEFFSLSPAERLRSVELTKATVPDSLILTGVSHDRATMLADGEAQLAAGADAFMLHQPVHPFWSLQGWIEGHRTLARAFPEIAIVPYIKDRRVTPQAIAGLLEAVPQVTAIKFAINDVEVFSHTLALVPEGRVTWLCGLAENWAPYFAAAGAQGFTSGLVNVDPGRSLRIHEALVAGDFPRAFAEQRDILDFEKMRADNASENNVSVVKEALAQLGLCRSTVRAPLSELRPELKGQVTTILDRWGIAGDVARTGELAGSVA